MWLYKEAHGNLGGLSPRYVQTSATNHTALTAGLMPPRRKEKEENGGRTAAARWQYLAVVLPHLWNCFSSSVLTLSLCPVCLSTAELLRLTTLLFPL